LTVQDDYSKLTIPTKTVIMGGSASVAEYKIFTFSTLQSPSPLQIRSQTYRPAVNDVADNDLPNKSPIWARLDGNTLIIESTDLEGLETERSGVIVLSYAGLEISMNVSQAGEHDNFLIVTEPDGGILPFAAYAGIPSGLIRVQASGHWTATLHMTGFSFDSSQATDAVKKIWTNPDPDGTAFDDGRGYNNTLGLIVPDEFDPSVDKFRVYTHSHNMGQAPREAIIVIELDGMEEQYSATIVLTQNYVKNLHYVHSAGDPNDAEERVTSGGTITFDGMGNVPTTGSYAGNNNWWYVFSGYEEGTTKILPWSAVMVIAGGADDRNHFQIVRNVEGEPEIPNATGYDVNDPGKNKVMIRAKGMNISGRDYRVTLRVQTDPGTFADIEVVQKPASFELTPGGLLSNKVPSSGGTSDKISLTVENGEGLKWKINSPSDITFSEFQTKAHDRRLVNYGKYPEASGRANDDITLVIVDASGNPTGEEFAYGKEFDVDKSFRVKFPKIYFPNRDIEVTASVTVTLNSAGATSGGIKQTVRVAQNALTRRPTSIYTTTTGGYGQIYPGESYSRQVRDAVAALGSINYSAGVVPEGATFLYRTNYGMNSGTPWTETNKFIDGDRGVFYLAGDYDGGNEIGGVSNAGSPLRSWGVTNADPYAALNTANDETKVWDFLFNRVGTPTVLDNTRIDMNYDGMAVTTIPASAVAIFTQTTNTARHHFVIDPKNRIIFCADAQLFDTQGPSAMKASILAHLMMYVDLAGGYGSGFSDMLIDSETEAGGGVPAPWDEWWGANAVENFERTYNRY
jgi:hypothetical protein